MPTSTSWQRPSIMKDRKIDFAPFKGTLVGNIQDLSGIKKQINSSHKVNLENSLIS